MAIDEAAQTADLRYLDAEHVSCPLGGLGGREVRSADDQSLGRLDGVLLDPARRRVRYLVVIQSSGILRNRRYLVPVDAAPHVEATGILRVEAHAAELAAARVDLRAVPQFSPDDVVTAMFAPHAA